MSFKQTHSSCIELQQEERNCLSKDIRNAKSIEPHIELDDKDEAKQDVNQTAYAEKQHWNCTQSDAG